MKDVDNNTEASYPEEMRSEFERRQNSINRARKRATAPVNVAPYSYPQDHALGCRSVVT